MRRFSLYALSMFTTILVCGFSRNYTQQNPTYKERDSFYPLSDGSEWKYGGTFGENIVIMAGDTLIGEKSYRICTTLYPEKDMHYSTILRREGKAVYSYTPDENNVLQENLIMRDDCKEGDTWEYKIVSKGMPSPALYKFRVAKTNLQRTVGQVEYKNVLRVESEFYMDSNGSQRLMMSSTIYYAQGFGMIETTQHITPEIQTHLVSAVIK